MKKLLALAAAVAALVACNVLGDIIQNDETEGEGGKHAFVEVTDINTMGAVKLVEAFSGMSNADFEKHKNKFPNQNENGIFSVNLENEQLETLHIVLGEESVFTVRIIAKEGVKESEITKQFTDAGYKEHLGLGLKKADILVSVAEEGNEDETRVAVTSIII